MVFKIELRTKIISLIIFIFWISNWSNFWKINVIWQRKPISFEWSSPTTPLNHPPWQSSGYELKENSCFFTPSSGIADLSRVTGKSGGFFLRCTSQRRTKNFLPSCADLSRENQAYRVCGNNWWWKSYPKPFLRVHRI